MRRRADRRLHTLVLMGVLVMVSAGCFGDHFAGVTLTNLCDVDVQVALRGNDTWTPLAVGEQSEFHINAPPDPERFIAVAVRADALGEPVGVELSDGSRLRLSGPLCPAPTP